MIFVSGYQDFSYVKQALSLKAYSYVLKPMDDSELIAALQKVRQDLDDERKRRDVEEAYQHMIPMAKNDLLIRLFEGEWEGEEGSQAGMLSLVKSYGLDKLNWPVRVAVLELDYFNWLQGQDNLSKHQMAKDFLYEVNRIGQKHGMPHCYKVSSYRIALLINEQEMEKFTEDIYASIRAKFPVTMTVGVGKPTFSMEQIHISYRQAMEAVDGKMFIGKGNLIMYETVSSEPGMIDARMLDTRMDTLFKAVKEYELVLIYDEIDKLFRSVSSLRSKFTIHNLAMYIIWKLDQQLKDVSEDLFEILGMEIHSLDVLHQFDTISDIRSWLVLKTFEISEYLRSKSDSVNHKLIREIIQTMQDRMSDNFTLKDIAQQFSFSLTIWAIYSKKKQGKRSVKYLHSFEWIKQASF